MTNLKIFIKNLKTIDKLLKIYFKTLKSSLIILLKFFTNYE